MSEKTLNPQSQPKTAFRSALLHWRLYGALILVALVSAVFYAFTAWRYGFNLFWLQAGLWGLMVVLILAARRLERRQRPNLAHFLTLFGCALPLIVSELVWEGATLSILTSGVLMIWLVGRLFLKARDWIWGGLELFFLAGVFLAPRLQPAGRFPITESVIFNAFFPLVTVVLVLLAAWQLIRTFQFGSIRTRLIIAFTVVALIPAAITGVITGTLNSVQSQQRLIDQLESVTSLKESQIRIWGSSLQSNLGNVFDEVDLNRLVTVVAEKENVLPLVHEYNRENLVETLEQTIDRTQIFTEIFIMDPSGKVILSTDSAHEGKQYENDPMFRNGLKETTIVPTTGAAGMLTRSIIASQPLPDMYGENWGVIAGRAKMENLNAIMLERAGLGETGETYLVDSNFILLTKHRYGYPGGRVESEGITAAIKENTNGTATYTNSAGEEVIGVYHWLPDLGIALLAEQTSREAFSSVRSIIIINLAAVAASLLAAVGAALYVSRGIARPIESLAKTSARIAAGDLELNAEAERADEIGALAVSFNQMTQQLRGLVSGLEQRVAERTAALERRSVQIQVAAEVARDITTNNGLDDLLTQAVNLVRSRFGFYHAGIFLLDGSGEYAVLRAATGEAGRQMLAQEHRLRVGEAGIVGAATGTGKARIAMDVGADAAHFKNPFLPDTRSEMAVPLVAARRVIGALDVQSTQEAAFDEQDITILQTMADQLAVAIENARLIEKLNQSVSELEQAYGSYTQQSWRAFQSSQKRLPGYRYYQMDIEPVEEKQPEAQEALQQGQTVYLSAAALPANERVRRQMTDHQSALAVPIKLRNQVIGVVNMRFDGDQIPADTIHLVEEASSRLALMLENARLLQDAQRLASREKQINLLANQVRGSSKLETILQTTVRELGKTLGASRATIHVGTPPDETPPNTFEDPQWIQPEPSGNGGSER